MATRHSITHNMLYWMILRHGCLRGEVHRMELSRSSQQGGQYPEGKEGKGAPRGGRNWGVDSRSR